MWAKHHMMMVSKHGDDTEKQWKGDVRDTQRNSPIQKMVYLLSYRQHFIKAKQIINANTSQFILTATKVKRLRACAKSH